MKKIGLLAVALVVAAGIASPAPAAAVSSTICEANETPCGFMKVISVGTPVVASSSHVVLSTSLGSVVCTSSSMSVKATTVSTQNVGALPAEMSAFSLSNCEIEVSMTKCTTPSVVVHLPYSAPALYIAGAMDGTLSVSSSGTGTPGFTLVCGMVINCTFTSGLTLDIKGGEPLQIIAKEESMGKEGGKCPTKASLSATWNASAPNEGKLWMAE